MKLQSKLAIAGTALALGAAPALAPAAGPPSGAAGPPSTVTTGVPSTVTTGKPSSTPGPGASLPAKAKAFGVLCQTESKKHVAGTPGTPFSACVTAMAKLAGGSTTSPQVACKAESRKHVAGTPGTPFSQCVSGAAKLLRDSSS